MRFAAYYGTHAWQISYFINFVYWNVTLNNKVTQQIKFHYNIGGNKIIVNKLCISFVLFPFLPRTFQLSGQWVRVKDKLYYKL
jgi:hypothetical protein